MERAPLWIFGYGSLIWNPGFAFTERRLAVLDGYARSFCMWSIHHRGTPELPGLVLALDEAPQERCQGLAFRVEDGAEDGTLAYLRARELISAAYVERRLALRLDSGDHVEATAFVVDRSHAQYCAGLTLAEQAAVIARAQGGRGSNLEYLVNTAAHLRQLGIHDPSLDWLVRRLGAVPPGDNAH